MGVSSYKTSEVPAAEEVVAVLEQQGFRVAAMGQPRLTQN